MAVGSQTLEKSQKNECTTNPNMDFLLHYPKLPTALKSLPNKCMLRRAVIFSIFILLFSSFASADFTNGDMENFSAISPYRPYNFSYSLSASGAYIYGTGIHIQGGRSILIGGNPYKYAQFSQNIDLTNQENITFYTMRSTVNDGNIYVKKDGTVIYNTVLPIDSTWHFVQIPNTDSGNHNITFYSYSSTTTHGFYIDSLHTGVSANPVLPSSNGTIYFQYDPYSVDSTMNVRYNECFDYNNTGYHWFGILQPLYYYNEYSVLKIDSGTYENSSYTAIDDILYQRLDPEGNCWDVYTRALTANDYGVLRAQLITKKDYYYGIKGLYMKYISSEEQIYDTDYAYHNNFVGNASATAPVSTTTNDTVDNVPDVSTMLDTSDSLPDNFDSDNDAIADVDDSDDDNNNMNDSIDTDSDNLPDIIDEEDQNPSNDGSTTDQDPDNDGVSDPIDTDDDGDGDPDTTDPDDDGDGVPDSVDNPSNSTYNSNQSYVYPTSGSNTTLNTTDITGYYDFVNSSVDSLFSPIRDLAELSSLPFIGLTSHINNMSSELESSEHAVYIPIYSSALKPIVDNIPTKVIKYVTINLVLFIILILLGRD